MIKKIDYTASIIILLLGVLHTALTPVLAVYFKISPVDFIAIGMMFILIGLINIARLKVGIKIINNICVISNLLGSVWIVFSFIYSYMHDETFLQGILPAIALCIVLIRSVIDARNHRDTLY